MPSAILSFDYNFTFDADDFVIRDDQHLSVYALVFGQILAQREQNYYGNWERGFFEEADSGVIVNRDIKSRLVRNITRLMR
jgi:hypothetical protein